MKKGFCYILVGAIVAVLLPAGVIAETNSGNPKFETQEMLKLDFDETSAEFTFSSNDPSTEHACEIKDSEMPDAGKVLALKRESTAEAGLYAELNLNDAQIEGNKGKYLIEYDVLTDMTDQWAPYIILAVGPNNSKLSVMGADSSEVICSYATDPTTDGWWAIHDHNPVNRVALIPNAWMNVKVLIDTVNDTADYYYDDTYVGTQGSDLIGSIFDGGISKIRFELWSHDSYQPKIFIDNITISKVRPTVEKVEIVDVSGKKKAATGTVKAVSDRIEISVENLSDTQAFYDTIALTDVNGDVAFTPIYDASTKICRLVLDSNMANGGSYNLSVLGKDYTFTIDYGQEAYIGKVVFKQALGSGGELTSITGVRAAKAVATAINPAGQSGSYTIIATCYNGNELVTAYATTVDLDENSLISEGSLTFAVPTTATSIKAYVFDNMTSLTPLSSGASLGSGDVEETGNNVFTVPVEGTKADENAVLCLFAPNKSAADIPVTSSRSDITNELAYLQQRETAEDGSASFTVKINENSASGTRAGYSRVGNTLTNESIVYVNRTENQTALNALKTSTDFANDVKINSAALGFGEYSLSVPDAAYEIFADYYVGKVIDDTDYDANIKIVHKSELLACTNNGMIDNIFDHKDTLSDDFSAISGYFDESYFTETLEEQITVAVKGKNLTSLANLRAAINEAFVLNLVKNPNGYKNLTPVLTAFAGDIGINTSVITDAISNRIVGNSYQSYTDLRNAINSAYTSINTPSGSNGGSSSSSGRVTGGTGIIKSEPVKEIPKTIYSDIPADHWASEAVVSLTEKGVLSGKGGDTFDPNAHVTREEFTKMIIAAFCEDALGNSTEMSFEDVKQDGWYYPYLAAAFNLQLISGYSDTIFGIGEKISRQDVAVILNRTATANNYNFSVPDSIIRFNDDSQIADYALDSVYTLKEAGIIKGDGGNYNPRAYATRAEAALIIYNMLSM